MKALIRRAKEGDKQNVGAATPKSQPGNPAASPPRALDALLTLPAAGLGLVGPGAVVTSAGSAQPVWLVEEWMSVETEREILTALQGPHAADFTQLRGKRTAKFGGDPGPPFAQECLPAWLEQLCKTTAMAIAGVLTDALGVAPVPNHVLVNHYMPGGGIMPHTDGPAYTPFATIVSIGSATVFDFWRDHAHAASSAPPALSVLVPPRSLLLFTGGAYASHLHGIADRRFDLLQAGRVANWGVDSRERWTTSSAEPPDWAKRQLDVAGLSPEGEASAAYAKEGSQWMAADCELRREERFSLTIRHVPPCDCSAGGT